jgi:hypothetical protein
LTPATDFLLFSGLSAFPEILGLFASFLFCHIVYLSILFLVIVFSPGRLWFRRQESFIALSLRKFEYSFIPTTNQRERLAHFHSRWLRTVRNFLLSVVATATGKQWQKRSARLFRTVRLLWFWLTFLLCVVQRAIPPAGEPTPVAGDPVARSAPPTGVENLTPAADFLLFDGFSAFPEILGLFASFLFGHIVYLSIVCCFVFCPSGRWPPWAKSVTVSGAAFLRR